MKARTFIAVALLATSAHAAGVGYDPFPGRPNPWEVAQQLGFIDDPAQPYPPPQLTADRPGFGAALAHPAVAAAYVARYGPRAMDAQGRPQPGPCGAENETSWVPRALLVLAQRGDFGPYAGAQPSHREVHDVTWDPSCSRLRSLVAEMGGDESASAITGPLPRPNVKAAADAGGLRLVLQVPPGPPVDGWIVDIDTGVFQRRKIPVPPGDLHYLPAESGQRVRVQATSGRKRGSWSDWAQIAAAWEPPPAPTPPAPDVVEPTLCISIPAQELHGPGPWSVRAGLCGGGK